MAGLKEIKRRLKSAHNTKKITYAMKLVSAAKLRKAQDQVTRSREYTDALNELLASLMGTAGASDLNHPLMQPRNEIKHIKLLVVGGSRGLCGPYNTNVNRRVEQFFRELKNENSDAQIESILLGRKPAEHYRRVSRSYAESFEKLPEDASEWPIDDMCKMFELEFLNGTLDEVYVIYTKFKSAISMTVECERILPLDRSSLVDELEDDHTEAGDSGIALFEPSPEEVFNAIIPRIMRSRVLQAGLDAKASEHGSRMTAMDAATTNASELIHKLTLTRNKLRQAGITAELLDIIGGAEAIN